MNVTIIRFKDLIKYIVVVLIAIVLIKITTIFFNNKKNAEKSMNMQVAMEDNIGDIKKKIKSFIFQTTIPEIGIEDENRPEDKETISKKIISSQIEVIDNIKYSDKVINEEQEDIQNKQVKKTNEEKQELEEAKTDVTTEVVSENNLPENYTDEYENIKIKNQSSHNISEELFQTEYNFTNVKDILIYHTHTCESYTPTENYNYEMTGNYRTTDLNYSVAKVGDKLEEYLQSYGYNVIHDKTYHDYPAYDGSYNRSQETVKRILDENPNIQTAIDLHRDAVGASNEYAPSVLINGESCAQLMLVIRN